MTEPGEAALRNWSERPDAEAVEELLIAIAQTPAPTGREGRRAALVAELWADAGYEPEFDEVGNVLVRVPPVAPSTAVPEADASVGAIHQAGTYSRLIVAAHLDSVFEEGVDVTVARGPKRWSGPGVGDNAASLAIVTRYLQTRAAGVPHPPLVIAATVGEEGLGDIRGARHLVAKEGIPGSAFIAFDGLLGTITDVAVGSRRYVARFTAQGGHSWGDHGASSAVHAAGRAIADLASLPLPRTPRSSLNVGQVWGGTSVNAIAESAGFNLDLRSVHPATLAELDRVAVAAIRAAAASAGAAVELEPVGDRPAGNTADERLVGAAMAAYARVAVTGHTSAGSTDANAAVAAGIPAVAFGGYRGGDAHRLQEWIDPTSLPVGLEALSALLELLA